MKSLPIHRYTLNIRKKTKLELEGKRQDKPPKTVTWTEFNLISALPPLKNPRILHKIRGKLNEEINNLIVKEIKGEFIGNSNSIY